MESGTDGREPDFSGHRNLVRQAFVGIQLCREFAHRICATRIFCMNVDLVCASEVIELGGEGLEISTFSTGVIVGTILDHVHPTGRLQCIIVENLDAMAKICVQFAKNANPTTTIQHQVPICNMDRCISPSATSIQTEPLDVSSQSPADSLALKRPEKRRWIGGRRIGAASS